MKKGYVYAMMAAVAAMTVSGCSSSSSAPASTAAESKTEAAASSESGTTAADTSDVKAAVDTIKFGLVAPLSGDNGAYGTKQEKGYELVPISQLICKEQFSIDHEGRQIPSQKTVQ